MTLQIFTWWLVIQCLGVVSLPLTTRFFRILPDRGYAFSKSIGLLLTSYGAWLLAMLGIVSFGVPLLVFVALVIGIGGILLVARERKQAKTAENEEPAKLWQAPVAFGKQHWRTILLYEGVFLLALVLMAWIRSYSPDPWGTERPMDFAFFNAIQQSHIFPPHDPWLAGYSINYYYFGYLMMAAMSLLSGLQPSVGFNLSLALTFALTALHGAGLVANLMVLTQHHAQMFTSSVLPALQSLRRLAARLAVMVLAVVLVLIASNQAGVLQVIIGDKRIVALDATQLVAAFSQSIGDISREEVKEIELPYPLVTREGDFGTLDTLERTDQIQNFDWWWPSRALWDAQPVEHTADSIRVYNITEFPFFSFWLGDMHPHVMALPFGVLAMALALETLARPRPMAFATTQQGWLDLLLVGLVLGSLYAINSWDLPTYTLLYAGALLLLFVRQADSPIAIRWRSLAGQLAGLVLTMFLLFLPFYMTFHSFAGANTEPLTNLPILAKLSEIVAPLNGSRSEWHAFLIIFGLFLLPLATFVYMVPFAPSAPRSTRQLLVWLAPALLVIGLLGDFPLLALAGLASLALYKAVLRADKTAEAFVLLVTALGCAICFGTDLIFIRDVFSSRMNTIFKFYYQVWLLWGIMSAYALWWLLARATSHQVDGVDTSSNTQPDRQRPSLPLVRAVVGIVTVLFVVLLAGSLVYPYLNISRMVRDDTPEGLAGKTPRQHTPAGAEAIQWLRDHVEPGEFLLEMVPANGGAYNIEGYAGVSASTGIPTVLGWTGHERQWRGGHDAAWDEIQPRQENIETIYRTTDAAQALELLRRYDVSYVYVGALERAAYPAESLAKFATIADAVFENEEVTIYRVK
jgi:YYY domain-containing protein